MIYDPTRMIGLRPMTIDVDKSKEELHWYQRMWRNVHRFIESDFFFYTTIVFIRIVQISLFVLAFYFMKGGRL